MRSRQLLVGLESNATKATTQPTLTLCRVCAQQEQDTRKKIKKAPKNQGINSGEKSNKGKTIKRQKSTYF